MIFCKTKINSYFLYTGGGNKFSKLEYITIPSSIKNIGDWSFSGLPALKNVTIENGVINIGNGVFSMCHSLSNTESNFGHFSNTFRNAFWTLVGNFFNTYTLFVF